jgi:hypothetical protein
MDSGAPLQRRSRNGARGSGRVTCSTPSSAQPKRCAAASGFALKITLTIVAMNLAGIAILLSARQRPGAGSRP